MLVEKGKYTEYIVSKSTVLESIKGQHAIQSWFDYGNLNMWQTLRRFSTPKDGQQRNCGQPIHKPYSQLLFYFILFQCNSKCQTTNLEWKLKQLVDEPEMYIKLINNRLAVLTLENHKMLSPVQMKMPQRHIHAFSGQA